MQAFEQMVAQCLDEPDQKIACVLPSQDICNRAQKRFKTDHADKINQSVPPNGCWVDLNNGTTIYFFGQASVLRHACRGVSLHKVIVHEEIPAEKYKLIENELIPHMTRTQEASA